MGSFIHLYHYPFFHSSFRFFFGVGGAGRQGRGDLSTTLVATRRHFRRLDVLFLCFPDKQSVIIRAGQVIDCIHIP